MRLGILTLHAQLNYGGLLQCWALQKALGRLGHDVQVVDVWLDRENRRVKGPFAGYPLKTWRHFLWQIVLGTGDGGRLVRCWRTMRFLRRRLKLTPYHFCDWRDAPADLGVDTLVVGSDQVWHGGDWGNPRPFLLDGAPSIPAIAYAGSFGMASLPERMKRCTDVEKLYREGLARFQSLSCREVEGVRLCAELGFSARHVVDPTLLLPPAEWEPLLGRPRRHSRVGRPRRIAVYFLSEDIPAALRLLEEWAKRENCRVELFVDKFFHPQPTAFSAWLRQVLPRVGTRVKVRLSAGPEEFARGVTQADALVTDSFHALMFAAIGDVNVRFVRPASALRQRMFARIAEFASCVKGPLVADSLAAALASLAADERVVYDVAALDARRADSLDYLQSALRQVVMGLKSLPPEKQNVALSGMTRTDVAR